MRIETDHKADEDQDISTQLSSLQQDQDDDDQRQSAVLDKARAKKLRLRQKNKIAAFNAAINDIDDEDKKCSNPFACQTKFLTAGRRPRVKSNLRARKRNFWQKTKLGGVGGAGNIVGKGFRRGRKIRRGRKQRPDVDVVEKETKSVDEIQENNKATEAFFPTTRTTTTTAIPRKETTTTQAVKEEENEIFDDFFDSGNDFFAASSTVSPVVFKGSPGPGFFSSPRPFSDGQVFFGTSPSPFGPAPGGPVGRPSFDNIGAHIDLGPPQVASLPEQLLHISSTVSNKIFIGSEDESTTTPSSLVTVTTSQTPKRAFPSFPIRAGDNLNFKQKLDFSRKTKTAFKFGRQPVTDKVEEQDEVVTEAIEEATESATTVTEPSVETETTTRSRFFVDLTGGQKPRVKSNLKFNRKLPNKERFLKKLALLKAKKNQESTTLPTEDESVTTPAVQTTPQQTLKPSKVQHKPFTFFGKVPDVGFTNTLLKFKSRNKALQNKLSASTESSLSVESELNEDGVIPDKVRKASKALADKNIRVEFKKKVDEDELSLGLKGKFLINPDGRKPRVKSNIRAKFANRGQHFPDSEEETFDGASSQLDLTPFNKQLETAEDEVNREKKEVNIAEAPSAAVFNQIQEAPKLKVDLSPPPPLPPQQFSHELPLFPLQPVILNTRQSSRNPSPSQKPPLPPSILKHINHITDIRSLPPLPPLFRLNKPSPKSSSAAPQPTTTQSPNNSLLEKMLVTDNHSPSSPPAAVSSPAVSPSISAASPSISPSSASSKLSAFRALQQQVEKQEESSQQLSLV